MLRGCTVDAEDDEADKLAEYGDFHDDSDTGPASRASTPPESIRPRGEERERPTSMSGFKPQRGWRGPALLS